MNVSEATAFSTICDWISGELDEAPEKEISYLATRSAKTLMMTPKLPIDLSDLQIVSVNASQDEQHRMIAEEYLKGIENIPVLEISESLGLHSRDGSTGRESVMSSMQDEYGHSRPAAIFEEFSGGILDAYYRRIRTADDEVNEYRGRIDRLEYDLDQLRRGRDLKNVPGSHLDQARLFIDSAQVCALLDIAAALRDLSTCLGGLHDDA